MSTGSIAPSMQQKLEDRIAKLLEEGARKRRQIFELEEDDVRKQDQIWQFEAEISELQAKLLEKDDKLLEKDDKLLEKDNEIERLRNLIRCLSDAEHERGGQVEELPQQPEESLHLQGTPEEDKASESSDYWPAEMPGPSVGKSKEGPSTPGQDETGHEPHEEVENSDNGSVQENRTDTAEKPAVLSRTASASAPASPDTGSNNLLGDASNSLASDMEALVLKNPWSGTAFEPQEPGEGARSPVRGSDMDRSTVNDRSEDIEDNPSGNPWTMSVRKPRKTGKGEHLPVRTSLKNRPAATDLSEEDLINRRPWDDFTRNVKGRERKAAEEADEKRKALKEQGLLPTQASGAMDEVHKKVKIDEHGNRQRIGIDHRVNDPSKKDPARNTLEPEAKGKGKGPAAIEPTTPPHIGIQEQAKTAEATPFRTPPGLERFAGLTFEEYMSTKARKAPPPSLAIPEHEERGSKPPKVTGAADPGSPKAPLENTKDENKPDEKAPKPAATGKGPGTQESADDKPAAKASPAVKPAPGEGGYAGALKAPPPPEAEKKGEQEGKGGMVSLGARNPGPSNTAAKQQPGGQPSQQPGSATRGRGSGRGSGRGTGRGTGRGSGTARGGAHADSLCYRCGQKGHHQANCPHRSGQGGNRGRGGDRGRGGGPGQGGDRGRGGLNA